MYKDSLKPIAELDGAGNVVAEFIYGSKYNIPDYVIKGGVPYRIISDHLGSPRFIVNSVSGAIVAKLEYDEFGNVLTDSSPGFTPFGFAGGLYDADTGLVRFGARDYDPVNGRWTSKDPIRFYGKGPNLYGYAINNPVNLVDIAGLYWEFSQSSGHLTYVDNETGNRTLVSKEGYSGYGEGLKNPDMQNIPNIGPIPQGKYNIGPAYRHEHLGPQTMDLEPTPETDIYERNAFRIHGDNRSGNQSGSTGCIVLPRKVRNYISDSDDHTLRVVP